MYECEPGTYDDINHEWRRRWLEPTVDSIRARELYMWVRDQTIYRKLAGDDSKIRMEQMITQSGIFVGRWMERYDASLQVLVNNMWLVAVENNTYRGQYISERHLRNEIRIVKPHQIVLELSGRVLSMREPPTVDHVIANLGPGILTRRR